MEGLKAILGQVVGFLGGLLSPLAVPPDQWPPWVFAGLGVAIVMGIVAYVWNRTGKGMLIILAALIFLVTLIIMRAAGN